MVDSDSDDYELMPSHELDDLRHEVSSLKKGSLTDGDKARVLIESMDRLTISLNRLITILDDAQKDIIDEYQNSKPAEKLNQLLEQNEMIAKALLAISDNITGAGNYGNYNAGPSNNFQSSQEPPASIPRGLSMPSQKAPMSNSRSIVPLPDNFNAGNMNNMNNMRNNMNTIPPMNQAMPQFNPQQMNNQMQGQMPNKFNNQMSMGPPPMSSMDDLPPMDEMPPLDSSVPNAPKKKFLGIM